MLNPVFQSRGVVIGDTCHTKDPQNSIGSEVAHQWKPSQTCFVVHAIQSFMEILGLGVVIRSLKSFIRKNSTGKTIGA